MPSLPARAAFLAIAALTLGGCNLTLSSPPAQFSSLEPDAAPSDMTAGEMPPELATVPDTAGGRGAEPLEVLARSERHTDRWMREPKSRVSAAASLPDAFSRKPASVRPSPETLPTPSAHQTW